MPTSVSTALSLINGRRSCCDGDACLWPCLRNHINRLQPATRDCTLLPYMYNTQHGGCLYGPVLQTSSMACALSLALCAAAHTVQHTAPSHAVRNVECATQRNDPTLRAGRCTVRYQTRASPTTFTAVNPQPCSPRHAVRATQAPVPPTTTPSHKAATTLRSHA